MSWTTIRVMRLARSGISARWQSTSMAAPPRPVVRERWYMSDTKLQERATASIKPLIPPDAEERVNRSFKQWNQIIRDHIRTETGLKLSDGDSRFAIPVRVVP